MRTAEARQRAAGFQQLQRAQMNLLVAAQRVRHRRPVARERRRIEDDQVEARDDAFVRLDGGVVLEPVEYIDGVEGAPVRQPVGGGIALGRFNRIGALVEQMNVCRPALAACKPKPPRKLKQSRTCPFFANCETAS